MYFYVRFPRIATFEGRRYQGLGRSRSSRNNAFFIEADQRIRFFSDDLRNLSSGEYYVTRYTIGVGCSVYCLFRSYFSFGIRGCWGSASSGGSDFLFRIGRPFSG